MIKKTIQNFFKYNEKNSYEFILPNSSNNLNEEFDEKTTTDLVSSSLESNLKYLKTKYNMLINSDIKIREFTLTINNTDFKSFLLYIDGMIDGDNVNDFILQPLLLKNSILMKEKANFSNNQILANKKAKKFDLEDFLFSNLIPQNTVSKENEFENIIAKTNGGFCTLFVDSLSVALCIEAKGFKYRAINEPTTESIVKGSHAGFIENLRVNTSLLRRIINNEKLIIEETTVGNISKTKVAICYMKDITNDDLVAEAKYRINNLKIDYLLSSGQLEQFIIDNYRSAFPQTISTERPDKTSNYLFLGRVAILIDGSPFAIILPAVLIDFLTSPEDFNLNYVYANFLRILRSAALICALLVPGLYIAITMYHYELIPSELLFAIIAARKAIPFPIIFEIIIMEICFELIQEASIRAPDSFTTTIRNNWCFDFR